MQSLAAYFCHAGSSDNAGAIIGALVGGIVGAVLITLLLFVILYCYCCRHEKFKKESKAGKLIMCMNMYVYSMALQFHI